MPSCLHALMWQASLGAAERELARLAADAQPTLLRAAETAREEAEEEMVAACEALVTGYDSFAQVHVLIACVRGSGDGI